uniref:Uncharacterized protein n=1 Tax=Arundo donax TaxID=35708 RepID=A0A0A8ZCY7_ARUDO
MGCGLLVECRGSQLVRRVRGFSRKAVSLLPSISSIRPLIDGCYSPDLRIHITQFTAPMPDIW